MPHPIFGIPFLFACFFAKSGDPRTGGRKGADGLRSRSEKVLLLRLHAAQPQVSQDGAHRGRGQGPKQSCGQRPTYPTYPQFPQDQPQGHDGAVLPGPPLQAPFRGVCTSAGLCCPPVPVSAPASTPTHTHPHTHRARLPYAHQAGLCTGLGRQIRN